MLVDGLADVPGPAAGCEGSPAADPGTPPVPPTPPATDTVAPTITGRSPASGARSVARAANITATFSESVTGVGNTTVRVTNNRGAVVAATVSYDDATRRATLDPSADLNADAECRVTLTGGIEDLVKNPPATTTWKFRTGR